MLAAVNGRLQSTTHRMQRYLPIAAHIAAPGKRSRCHLLAQVDKLASAGWAADVQRHYFAGPNGTAVEGTLYGVPAEENDEYFYADE